MLFHITGKIRTHGIGGGHKQRYRIIDFQRLRYEEGKEEKPFEERVVEVRYDPCRYVTKKQSEAAHRGKRQEYNKLNEVTF